MLQGMLKRLAVATAGCIVIASVATAGPVLQGGSLLGDNAGTPFGDLVNSNLALEDSVVAELDLDPTPGVPVTVLVPLGNQDYELDLVPHSIRSANYAVYTVGDDGLLAEVESDVERTLRGTVVGVEGSVVAASVLENGLFARVRMPGGDEYFIEPLMDKVPGANFEDHVVYHKADIIPADGVCETTPDMTATDPVDPDDSAGGQRGIEICSAELGIDADFQYYQDWGSSVTAVENRVSAVINTVNIQYETEVQITHAIAGIVVRTSSGSNPYSSNDAGTLLDQTRSEWLGMQGSIPHDIAQLFTGRNVNGGTIGVAWLNAVCSSLRYSVVESDCCGSFGCATDLTAHELGHNWGADHCDCTSNTMNPFIVCANDFTNNSINDITGFKNSIIGCLDCGPPGPVDTDVVTVNAKSGSVILSGGPAEAQDSDDTYVETFSATVDGNQRCKTVYFMDGSLSSVSRLDVEVEVATSIACDTRVHIRQFPDNGLNREWVKLEPTFPTDPNDTISGYLDVANPNLYVKDSNGRIHIRVFSTKANTPTGFTQYVDHVEVISTP